jgi:LEA14-like dessication related protein
MLFLVRLRLATFVLACVCLIGGCKSLDGLLAAAPKPTARVLSAELKNLSLEGLDLVFHVEVANPYSANLPLADLTYALNSVGNTLLQGGIKPAGTVPARGTTVIRLPARLSFAALMKTLKSVTPGSVVPYQVELNLSIDAPVLGMLTLPLSHAGELPIPAVPQVELTSVAIDKLSLDQITTLVKLRVKNTNQFPLDLTELGVKLALGGMEVGGSKLAKSVSLPSGADIALEIPISFSPRSVGIGLMNLLRGKQIGYSVSGSIQAESRFGPLALPFNHAGNTAVTR